MNQTDCRPAVFAAMDIFFKCFLLSPLSVSDCVNGKPGRLAVKSDKIRRFVWSNRQI